MEQQSEWQKRETFDEMDEYLDGDWRPESLAEMETMLDQMLGITPKEEKADDNLRRCE